MHGDVRLHSGFCEVRYVGQNTWTRVTQRLGCGEICRPCRRVVVNSIIDDIRRDALCAEPRTTPECMVEQQKLNWSGTPETFNKLLSPTMDPYWFCGKDELEERERRKERRREGE